MFILYIFFSFLPLLYLRALSLGEHTYIDKQTTLFDVIFNFFYFIIINLSKHIIKKILKNLKIDILIIYIYFYRKY